MASDKSSNAQPELVTLTSASNFSSSTIESGWHELRRVALDDWLSSLSPPPPPPRRTTMPLRCRDDGGSDGGCGTCVTNVAAGSIGCTLVRSRTRSASFRHRELRLVEKLVVRDDSLYCNNKLNAYPFLVIL